ncbi:MAG: hypothetical protein E7F14_03950 [Enterococcus faecalis]|nr:hypothetical protein [Enterococcus faecalis]
MIKKIGKVMLVCLIGLLLVSCGKAKRGEESKKELEAMIEQAITFSREDYTEKMKKDSSLNVKEAKIYYDKAEDVHWVRLHSSVDNDYIKIKADGSMKSETGQETYKRVNEELEPLLVQDKE